MFHFGFSTGALALGDFRRALGLLANTSATAVELSALREHELPLLMEAADTLPLKKFKYVSVHAPSHLKDMTEKEAAALLLPCVQRRWHVVVHPDSIKDPQHWAKFGSYLCLENMDKRKPTGRTASELRDIFHALPKASLCLDLAHARQIDTTMGVARSILSEFGNRLAQLHLSELDSQCRHAALSIATVSAVGAIAHLIRQVPVILESQIAPAAIGKELEMAAQALQVTKPSSAPARASA